MSFSQRRAVFEALQRARYIDSTNIFATITSRHSGCDAGHIGPKRNGLLSDVSREYCGISLMNLRAKVEKVPVTSLSQIAVTRQATWPGLAILAIGGALTLGWTALLVWLLSFLLYLF